jgi:hypothetical protein
MVIALLVQSHLPLSSHQLFGINEMTIRPTKTSWLKLKKVGIKDEK